MRRISQYRSTNNVGGVASNGSGGDDSAGGDDSGGCGGGDDNMILARARFKLVTFPPRPAETSILSDQNLVCKHAAPTDETTSYRIGKH